MTQLFSYRSRIAKCSFACTTHETQVYKLVEHDKSYCTQHPTWFYLALEVLDSVQAPDAGVLVNVNMTVAVSAECYNVI